MSKKCNIKKLEIVEYIKFKDISEERLTKIQKFVNCDIKLHCVIGCEPYLKIKELNCGKRVNIGDYIIRDNNGVLYVSSPEAFKRYKKKHDI